MRPAIPLLSGAVFGGRMTMRIKGPALPGRWRFGHVVGTGYRHHMELSVFGRRIVTAQEWYLDGTRASTCPPAWSRASRRWTARQI